MWFALSANSLEWLIPKCLKSDTFSTLYPRQQSEYTMLSGTTLRSMMGYNVADEASNSLRVDLPSAH